MVVVVIRVRCVFRFLISILGIFIVSALAACSGGPDAGLVRIGLLSPPRLLEPALIKSQAELLVAEQVFEGLVEIDTSTGAVLPCLAKEWTLGADGLEYRFSLASATWTDGRPVTAQDVRDSWLRMLDPALRSDFGWIPARYIEGADAYYSADPASHDKAALEALRDRVAIRVESPRVLSVRLTRPDSRFLWALAHGAFRVLPSHGLDRISQEGIKVQDFIGSGPFVPDSIQDKSLELRSNPLYRNAGSMKVNRLELRTYDTVQALVSAWKDRQLDHVPFLPRESWKAVHELDGLQVNPSFATYYFVFNTRSVVLKDLRVRQALSLALPVRDLVEKLINRGLIPSGGILPAMAGIQALEPALPDAVKAKTLLVDAGFDGQKNILVLDLVYNKNESNILVAEYLADVWKRTLGVEVKLEGLEMKDFLLRQEKGDFQVLRSGWQELVLDPLYFLERFVSSSSINDSGYRNPAFDTLVAGLRNLRPEAWATNLGKLKEGERMLLEDKMVLPLFQYTQPCLVAAGIWSNLGPDTLDHYRYANLVPVAK